MSRTCVNCKHGDLSAGKEPCLSCIDDGVNGWEPETPPAPKPRKILAPHKEQDGWVYVRMRKSEERYSEDTPIGYDSEGGLRYDDTHPGARIISSRKAEEAVETWEYLRRCEDEGLSVHRWATRLGDGWDVIGHRVGNGATLREAYHRYKANQGN